MSNETVAAVEAAELAPRVPEACSVEIFRRGVPGDVKIWYWVSESHPTSDVPYPDPVDIISWDETYYVIVCITLSDAVRRHLCGKLCVDIDVGHLRAGAGPSVPGAGCRLGSVRERGLLHLFHAACGHVPAAPGIPQPLRPGLPTVRHRRFS